MTDPTFEALLNHYQERGQRILELEQLCRDIWSVHCTWAKLPTKELGELTIRMQSLGLLGEE